ncbi:MAG: 50S ribosomal protein L11 methyltransferase, partial [Planctomycetota bacterium]
MPTFTAFTSLESEAPARRLAEAMERLDPEPTGIGVFEMEDGSGLWEVAGYFVEPPDDVALALLAAANGAKPFIVSELPETDWVAKVRRELAPVEAGRFWLYGSHDAETVPAASIGLLIEASMAFGTGHHGTTLGCLRVFDRLLAAGTKPRSVADIGCGTAVLAMAAAKVLDATVVAGDIDAVAVDVAQANISANGLEGRITLAEAAGFDAADIRAEAPFDLVFANILKAPLLELASDMAQAMAAGGQAILSGILTPQADEVIARYEEAG